MENTGLQEGLVERVEKAAAKGAREGAKNKSVRFLFILLMVMPLVSICGLIFLKWSIEKKWNDFAKEFIKQFTFSDPADAHDLVIKNNGLLGYTAADFAEAILGEASQLKKIEIYETKISDAVTLTDTGFANWAIFTKTQVIVYNGTATYTVDLSHLSKTDIQLNEKEKKVVIYIPHSVCGTINIPGDEMEFEDTERGWLAFGDIQMTPEQCSLLESEARKRMEEKLSELKESEKADRFAKMTVWEMYQPIISAVSPEYVLEVEFR